ncbi:peptidase U32 family protein [Butyrivibrio sp. MC2013]|uniref:peptidase U32 family protein n=1 Tax=Butyrivibrio sp. MC2013 TaxID=1280686 RepID=UPI0003FC0E3C|nr:U32 family peptidase [Butyrivibrio sp. MC2013]
MSDIIRSKRPELLAPAGNYEAFLAAVNAGADAVYLGGNRFGARAYADNFDTEHVIRAIDYAHIYGRKVYLTVNTLIKEEEYLDLYDYLQPFADAGLDGVIVQDFGVFGFIREHFPGVELHTSTQMAVTGPYGARLLKKAGAVRVVPARELSLEEMKAIRRDADIEVEAFVHGAMCYSYSGICLFSGIVGGRSGNRGRCAQPCRLPYTVETGGRIRGKDGKYYPLSLKDMCTIEFLPLLIEAGIDSFKIEGRMKKAEYAAGVTSIYRKYIDRYYEYGTEGARVSAEDMDILRSLYIRSEISEGYYKRHNGREMVTLTAPGYEGSDDAVLKMVRERYLVGEKKLKISLKAVLHEGEESVLSISCGNASYEAKGAAPEPAANRPMDRETILKSLCKFGNSFFEVDENDCRLDIRDSGNGIFIPVKELNDLRRAAAQGLMKELSRGV